MLTLPSCPCVGVDHRTVWSHSPWSLWEESVLYRSQAHRHRPVWAPPEGGESEFW